MIIAINSLNTTSTASSLIVKFEKSLMIKKRDGTRPVQKEFEDNCDKSDVKTNTVSMKRQSLITKGTRKNKQYALASCCP